ncbi:MAG: UDP-3-O-(3-hydroxymyristoyl)glucosamine N-acyltransferase [Gammaproteobacteria bacterium]
MKDGEGISLGELVDRLGGTLKGGRKIRISTVGTLAEAGPQALSFLSNSHYRSQLSATTAGCVVLGAADAGQCPVAAIVADDPYVYYARAAALIAPPPAVAPGLHPSAIVDASAHIDPSAWVGPRAVIGADTVIGAGASIGPGCVLGDKVHIGAGSRLSASVTILAAARIGSRCLLHPGVVIGGDGFGIAHDGERWIKVPQLGSVEIGDDVEIGANTAVDRGAIENTIIEEGVKLDNLIQVGHNVRIGAHTVIAGCTGISGSSRIGARCMIAGQVGIAGHISIADDTVITGKCVVNHTISEPGGQYSGALPMDESRKWRRNSARFRSLDELARRVARLERQSKDKET